jgi:hypothetical protein
MRSLIQVQLQPDAQDKATQLNLRMQVLLLSSVDYGMKLVETALDEASAIRRLEWCHRRNTEVEAIRVKPIEF